MKISFFSAEDFSPHILLMVFVLFLKLILIKDEKGGKTDSAATNFDEQVVDIYVGR